MRDPYKPRGRMAHSGHLNKVGQAWSEYLKPACWIGKGKMYGKIIDLAGDHRACPKCGETIRIDGLGYAFCQCQIWNDGRPFNHEYRSHHASDERARKRFARSLVAR